MRNLPSASTLLILWWIFVSFVFAPPPPVPNSQAQSDLPPYTGDPATQEGRLMQEAPTPRYGRPPPIPSYKGPPEVKVQVKNSEKAGAQTQSWTVVCRECKSFQEHWDSISDQIFYIFKKNGHLEINMNAAWDFPVTSKSKPFSVKYTSKERTQDGHKWLSAERKVTWTTKPVIGKLDIQILEAAEASLKIKLQGLFEEKFVPKVAQPAASGSS